MLIWLSNFDNDYTYRGKGFDEIVKKISQAYSYVLILERYFKSNIIMTRFLNENK